MATNPDARRKACKASPQPQEELMTSCLDFWLPDPWNNQLLLFKLLSLWCFVWKLQETHTIWHSSTVTVLPILKVRDYTKHVHHGQKNPGTTLEFCPAHSPKATARFSSAISTMQTFRVALEALEMPHGAIPCNPDHHSVCCAVQ